MPEYKCICCGEIKECDKECSCLICGYKMLQMPYSRSEALINEIRNFILKLRVEKNLESHIYCYREVAGRNEIISKQEVEKRFPDFNKIREYACLVDKTEKFIEHVNKSILEICKFIHKEFHEKYKVDSDKLKAHIETYDELLEKTLAELDISIKISEPDIPDIRLDYSETPDNELVSYADEMLDLLEKLVLKIHKFIKFNNMYGTAFKHRTRISYKPSKDNPNYKKDMEKAVVNLKSTLAKKYYVDITSDGKDELDEMLKVMWNGIYVIMTVPTLKKNAVYEIDGNDNVSDDKISEEILSFSHKRYSELDSLILSKDFLADKNEDELFSLYNKLIELDYLGIMGVNRANLLIPGENEKKLNSLIGMKSVKDSISKIKAYALANNNFDNLNFHMCFYGNPGTGKTEVARIIAGILYENKILPSDKVIEVDRGRLVGRYVGETPQKTMEQIEKAMGGVLFIDEAYSLVPKNSSGDYGHEALATLIKAMEDYRGKFCVILAGYHNQMNEMISLNPGFKSRIQFELNFPNYSREELGEILKLMLQNKNYTASKETVSKILDITDVIRKEPNFANAREIRNILDGVIMCQNIRTNGANERELGIVDVNRYIKDNNINLPTMGNGVNNKILTAEEELEKLVGLSGIKRMVKKIKAYAKRNKNEADFNLHMCFYGNPGTGKTEVARIISRILYDVGVLAEAKLVETDAHGLIGKYVGETAPKTEDKVRDAMGGVLFIDEAYGLSADTDGTVKSYGDEAIAVLLKQMEDKRGQFCVILAGYQQEMQTMLSSNPGMKSRIQFTLEFPDYTMEELGEIAETFIRRKKYEIAENALAKILDITEYYRKKPDFANARTVRNIVDQVIMNQNLRTEDEPDNIIILSDVEDYISDEKIDLSNADSGMHRIGFV